MGNTSTHDHDYSICRFNFLSSKTLTQTSLHPHHRKKSLTTFSTISDHESKSSAGDIKLETKDSPDSPDSREGCHSPPVTQRKHIVTENDFHIMKVLGVETCGRVYLVKKDDDQKLYTMKTICKRKAYSLGCIDSLGFEKEILTKARHPFLPKLEYTFENDKKIFFVFDFIETERLNTVLQRLNRFSEEITKFYSAEILLALEFLHTEMKVSYTVNTNDILLDPEGHIQLMNFGHCRTLDLDHASKSEVSKRKMIDVKDFGCLVYELLTGSRPSKPENDKKTVDGNTPKHRRHWPKYISKNARDLITRLLNPKAEERLGYNGFDEIKHHPFFDGVQWRKMQKKLVYPPINLCCHKGVLTKLEEEEEGEAVDLSNDSEDACELDEIILKRPRDILPDTLRGESYEHHFPTYNYLED